MCIGAKQKHRAAVILFEDILPSDFVGGWQADSRASYESLNRVPQTLSLEAMVPVWCPGVLHTFISQYCQQVG